MSDDNEISAERVSVEVWPADPEHDLHDTIVVQVDTLEAAGRVRVNLNDGTIYEGNPETDATPEVQLLRALFQQIEHLEAAAGRLTADIGLLHAELANRARALDVNLRKDME